MGCATWKPSTPPQAAPLQAPQAKNTAFYFASLRATYFGKQGRLKGELGLITSAPDKLYIEVRGPGGEPISTFTCDGERVALFELEGPRFYQGAANPRSMARLLPLPLEPKIAVDLLLGKLPMPPEAKAYRTRGEGQQIEGTHPTLGRLVVTRFSPSHWRWELPDEPLRIDFKKPQADGIFTELLIRHDDEEVALKLSDIRRDGEPPANSIFQLQAPEGVSIQPL